MTHSMPCFYRLQCVTKKRRKKTEQWNRTQQRATRQIFQICFASAEFPLIFAFILRARKLKPILLRWLIRFEFLFCFDVYLFMIWLLREVMSSLQNYFPIRLIKNQSINPNIHLDWYNLVKVTNDIPQPFQVNMESKEQNDRTTLNELY